MNSDPCQTYRPFPVGPLGTIFSVQDYAGAWTAQRGRCHRFVYTEDDGHPTNCPEPPVRSGWRRDGQDRRRLTSNRFYGLLRLPGKARVEVARRLLWAIRVCALAHLTGQQPFTGCEWDAG